MPAPSVVVLARRRVPWLAAVCAVVCAAACAAAPDHERPTARPLAGHYRCIGTNDPTIQARGFVDLGPHGAYTLELAFPAWAVGEPAEPTPASASPAARMQLVGRWRTTGEGLVELLAAEDPERVNLLLVSIPEEGTLHLVGACVCVEFVRTGASTR